MGALNIPAVTINVGLFIQYNLNENLLCKCKVCKIMTLSFNITTAIIALCIKGILNNFLLYLLNLEKFKIYIQIHTNIAPTCFGLRPSSGNLY